MATFTINVQGIEQKKRTFDLIMQNVNRNGSHKIEITEKVGFEDLNANELVQFKILKRTIKSALTKQDEDYFVYTEGENFIDAKVLGAYNYIEKRKEEINPSKSNKFLNFLSNNPLIVAVFSSLVTALITWLLSCN